MQVRKGWGDGGVVELPDGISQDDAEQAMLQLHAQDAAKQVDVGRGWDAIGRGYGKGLSLGWLDEGAGALAAAAPFLDREATDTGGNKGYFEGLADRYHHARDFYRSLNEQAQKAHPGLFLAGELGGGAQMWNSGLFNAGVPATASRLQKIAGTMQEAGQIGLVGAAGESEQNNVPGVMHDALRGAEVGMGSGALSETVLEPIERFGLNQGRRALSNVASRLSAKLATSDAAVKAAHAAGAFRPLGTSEGLADRLETARELASEKLVDILTKLAGNGVHGPDVTQGPPQAPGMETVPQQLRARGDYLDHYSPSKGIGNKYRALADHIEQMALEDNQRFMSLEQSEAMKRGLQEEARAAYQSVVKNPIGARAMMDRASILQHGTERAIEQQAALSPEAAKAFIPAKQALGPLIEASEAANVGAARELMRSSVDPRTVAAMVAQAAHAGISPATALTGAMAHLAGRRGAQTAAWAALGAANNAHRYILPMALSQSGLQANRVSPYIDQMVEENVK